MKKHRPYQLLPYDQSWPEQFETKKKNISDILGDCILEIHHMGSTSVPGMMAKPQLDILVIVDDLDNARAKVSEMEKRGFVSRGNYTHIGEEYFTEDGPLGQRLVSIHVLPVGHEQIEKILSFRDYLRENEEARNRYLAVKKELYQKYADNYHEYDSGKGLVIKELQEKAVEWRRTKNIRSVMENKDEGTINVKLVESQAELLLAKEIRRQVFQLEQNIDFELEFDSKDAEAEHFIAYLDNEAVGTTRVRYMAEKTAKLERLAVLRAYRGVGVGKKIMHYVIDYLKVKGIKKIMLNSQEQAKKFYEDIGFEQKGSVFEEARIPHIEMWKEI